MVKKWHHSRFQLLVKDSLPIAIATKFVNNQQLIKFVENQKEQLHPIFYYAFSILEVFLLLLPFPIVKKMKNLPGVESYFFFYRSLILFYCYDQKDVQLSCHYLVTPK